MRVSRLSYAVVVLVIVLVAFAGCSNSGSRSAAKPNTQGPRAASRKVPAVKKQAVKSEASVRKVSLAEAAIKSAAMKNRYVFITFFRKADDASTSMIEALKPVQEKLSHRADFVKVDVDDAVQQDIVSQYGADRSPIPLTIVVAPNGAVTAGYPNEIATTDFSDAFVSPGMATIIKAMQSQRFAVVCLQSSRTRHNKESLAAAKGLANAQGFAGMTELVRINPSDPGEARTLRQLQLSPRPSEAQVVVLVPPGKVAGRFSGAVSAETMVATVTQACGPGGSCGPSG